MSESKKLSELIDILSWKNIELREYQKEESYRISKEISAEIREIKNQIDQKFEELRCEYEKEGGLNENDDEKYLNIKVNHARNIIEGNGFEIKGDEKIFREFVKGFLYEKDTDENP